MAASYPLLFDLGARKPTTRDVANTVRAGGIAALTEAERRADRARYQEITCRSALNPVKGMPFEWTLNPYRGCTHGCHYCYARRYHAQFEMNADDEFADLWRGMTRARISTFGLAKAAEFSATDVHTAIDAGFVTLVKG